MADFEKAFKILLENEGGYVNDKDDAGGETKYGISKRSYPDVDVEHLTVDTAKEIYKRDYWDPLEMDEWPYCDLTYRVFDFAVNMGTVRATSLLQIAVNSVQGNILKVDGVCGPATISAMMASDLDVLFKSYKAAGATYYYSLNNRKYIKGWLTRAFK